MFYQFDIVPILPETTVHKHPQATCRPPARRCSAADLLPGGSKESGCGEGKNMEKPATASNRRFPKWANFDSFMGLMISHTLGCTGMYMDLYPQAKNKKNVFFPFTFGAQGQLSFSPPSGVFTGFSRQSGPASWFS